MNNNLRKLAAIMDFCGAAIRESARLPMKALAKIVFATIYSLQH